MHISSRILFNILWLAIAIAIFHIAAIKFYFYWTYPWYDIPMHILGGVLIAQIALWLFHYSKQIQNSSFSVRNIFRISLWSVFIVGVLWEVFERKVGITTVSLPDTIDSVKDILDDMIGSLIAGWYFVFKYKK